MLNPPLVVYNTENGASLQKLRDKSQILGKKIVDIIAGNCENIPPSRSKILKLS